MIDYLIDVIKDRDAEIKALRSLLSVAACPTCDGRGWYVETVHACRTEQECMKRCPEPVQVQCEWCDRRRTALDSEATMGNIDE